MGVASIRAVRSFNRSVTQRIGLFTDRFLDRDRPLAEARLIFEIGSAGVDVRELRARLGLDSGYLSRLLRSLEQQGLVEVVPLPQDRRIRRASLTVIGDRELRELDRRSDEFARSLLDPLAEDEKQRMLRAMAEVERLLSVSATTFEWPNPTSTDARWCLDQYAAELAERFDAGFDLGRSISADAEELTAPRGAFLLARLDARPVGCGALKTAEPGVGSIKRMWVAPSTRGLGIGRRILAALETRAVELGFSRVRLETNRALGEAQTLYRRNGYTEVAAFNDDPYADHWFEKTLRLT